MREGTTSEETISSKKASHLPRESTRYMTIIVT